MYTYLIIFDKVVICCNEQMKLEQSPRSPFIIPLEFSDRVAHVFPAAGVVVHTHCHITPTLGLPLPVLQSR